MRRCLRQPPCTRSNPRPQPATAARPHRQRPRRPPSSPRRNPQDKDKLDRPTIIRMNVNEVNLIFTVTDKHGHYIPNLQQSDFALLDDRKAPSHVKSFHQQINLPLRVGIVIDASTSIRTRFQFEQQSAVEFLLEILKARSDRAFVMGFDVTPTVTQDWTNNIDALETGVNRMRPGGGTAMYRCRLHRLPRQAAYRARPGAGAQGDGADLRRRRQRRAMSTRTRPSRNASGQRPSSTPSALIGRPAAARATRC